MREMSRSSSVRDQMVVNFMELVECSLFPAVRGIHSVRSSSLQCALKTRNILINRKATLVKCRQFLSGARRWARRSGGLLHSLAGNSLLGLRMPSRVVGGWVVKDSRRWQWLQVVRRRPARFRTYVSCSLLRRRKCIFGRSYAQR